jgi:hypothetical protein
MIKEFFLDKNRAHEIFKYYTIIEIDYIFHTFDIITTSCWHHRMPNTFKTAKPHHINEVRDEPETRHLKTPENC